MKCKTYNFPTLEISEAEKLWLQEIYSAYLKDKNSDSREIRVSLLEKVPPDFNPTSIDPRLYWFENNITLLGIWHIDPETDLIQKCDEAFIAIRECLKKNPHQKHIFKEYISQALGVSPKEASKILYAIYSVRAGLLDGADWDQIKWHLSRVSISDEKTFKNILAYEGIEKHINRFFQQYEPKVSGKVSDNKENSINREEFLNALELKPNIYGFGIDLMKIWRACKKYFNTNITSVRLIFK